MNYRNKNNGFTLIEIMVAVSIFVIVAFIATSTLLVVIDANRRASAWRSIMDNVNFAVDSMSFKMKFGSDPVVSSDGKLLVFSDRENNLVSYCAGEVATSKKAIFKCSGNVDVYTCPLDCQPITSSDIDIIELKVSKSPCLANCPTAPRELINILVRAQVDVKGVPAVLDFQTSVSQGVSSSN